jgi:hypothetical protein
MRRPETANSQQEKVESARELLRWFTLEPNQYIETTSRQFQNHDFVELRKTTPLDYPKNDRLMNLHETRVISTDQLDNVTKHSMQLQQEMTIRNTEERLRANLAIDRMRDLLGLLNLNKLTRIHFENK